MSKKQPIIDWSSTEAEFVVTTEAAREIVWCRLLLYDLGFPQTEPPVLSEENHQVTYRVFRSKCKFSQLTRSFCVPKCTVTELEVHMHWPNCIFFLLEVSPHKKMKKNWIFQWKVF